MRARTHSAHTQRNIKQQGRDGRRAAVEASTAVFYDVERLLDGEKPRVEGR